MFSQVDKNNNSHHKSIKTVSEWKDSGFPSGLSPLSEKMNCSVGAL